MTNILYIGTNYRHLGEFIYDIPSGFDFWLIVLLKTPAIFEVDGVLKEYPAYSIVVYPPHYKIFYKEVHNEFINDWVRFETTESYIIDAKIPFGTPFSLYDSQYCIKIFELLATEKFLAKEYHNSSIQSLFQVLFNKLLESYANINEAVHPKYYNLFNLRAKIFNNPGAPWTITTMADLLQISPGYLQTIYKKTFGISCLNDVINSRIQLAKEYLKDNTRTISEVAFLCGYNNIEHFARQFKQVTGQTPGNYSNYYKSLKSIP